MKNLIKNIVSTKKEKNTQKLPMPSHVKKGFRRYCAVVVTATICSSIPSKGILLTAAAGGSMQQVIPRFWATGFYAFKSIRFLMKGKVLWKEAGKFLDLSITLSHYSFHKNHCYLFPV